jgi:Ca2+:H+ antiporter
MMLATRPETRSLSARAPIVVPLVAVLTLAVVWGRSLSAPVEVVVIALLAGSVLAAVHHAEVVAERVGEPFGSLILAVAVTVIEVGLIVSLMVSGAGNTSTLARDTVFAAVIITCNGIVGLSLLIGALRRKVAVFNPEGTGAAFSTVITLAVLCLVFPRFTTSAPGAEASAAQLVFAAIASLALYGTFVFVQNVRHREEFLPVVRPPKMPWRQAPPGPLATLEADAGDLEEPTTVHGPAATSFALLLAALVGVVGLAKVESHTIESAVSAAGLPQSFVGVIIALLVLLPETLAAVRNARRDRVQVSLNLGLGSAMASIGLTIPTIAVASIWLDGPLELGLGPTQLALLAITAVVGVLTIVPGRAMVLQGVVHLALFAAFVVLAANP